MEWNDDECQERRNAEIEFVQSAYTPNEAWCEEQRGGVGDNPLVVIVRRLHLPCTSANTGDDSFVAICLRLALPLKYPAHAPLQVDVSLDDNHDNENNNVTTTSGALLKSAWNAVPKLLSTLRAVAEENQGEESVFLVFHQAQEWIENDWPGLISTAATQPEEKTGIASRSNKQQQQQHEETELLVLGRRLIYSHHIISKTKRADIKSLASNYRLTGYMKVGWPGLLIVEGLEEDCIAFYDDIRRWNWQYLVVRGEQQETIQTGSSTTDQHQQVVLADAHRKFQEFLEVDDMSIVAQHCREVGLEALFRTSMKVYDNNNDTISTSTTREYYGAMVHVDHMNNAKAYRKWIRKTSQETNCYVLIKQSLLSTTSKNKSCDDVDDNDDNNKERPKIIIVGILGETKGQVSGFLKRWRTSKVDVDSRGKPCYERQMTVVVEGIIHNDPSSSIVDGWDDNMSSLDTAAVTMSENQLAKLLETVGGTEWKDAFQRIARTHT
eukprot:scaffold1637_cov108-Cylindrotheca_fusiformis.AAC.5